MTSKPNIGVVGCGYWGPNLIRNFNALNDCTLKTICDANTKRLEHMSSIYPHVQTGTSYEEMITDPELDAVVVAVPVHLHYDLAKKSLAAGKHTFIEKPMAATTEQCAELIEMAHDRDLILMVGHTFLYSPAVRKIKEIVDSGTIGKIRYISSRRLNLGLYQKDINVVWDLGPHDLSIILYIMNQTPVEVNCRGKTTLNHDIQDVSNMSLLFADGGFATVHNSWLDPKKVRDMAIVGDKKMIVYDDLEPIQKIRIYDMRVDPPPYTDTFKEFNISYHYGDMNAPFIEQEEPLKNEAQHFVDCIREDRRPLTCGASGLQLVHILEAASESMRNRGEAIDLPTRFPRCCEACGHDGGCKHAGS